MLTAPWFPDDSPEFSGFAHRTSQLDEVARLLAREADPNDFEVQCRIYDEVGINSDTFTDEEINYIIKEVQRRV